MKINYSIKELKLIANTIRKDIIKMLAHAGSGHTAGALGMADIFAVLYFRILNHKPRNANWKNRDRVIVSNGHICPVWYATLANAGYFSKDELLKLRKINSKLQGHPHLNTLPGIENTGGPLGQGISFACGVAFAGKLDKKDYMVYCSLGDGEIEEGQVWEAMLFAAKYKLDNLCAFIDRNYIQIDGNTEDVMPLGDVSRKVKEFGWNVIEINGHDYKQIINAFETAKKARGKGKPVMIIANTIPGKDVSFIEGRYEWHGKPPNKEQAVKALEELDKIEQLIKTGKK